MFRHQKAAVQGRRTDPKRFEAGTKFFRALLLGGTISLSAGSAPVAQASPWPISGKEVTERFERDEPSSRIALLKELSQGSASQARTSVVRALSDDDAEVRRIAGRLALHFGYAGLGDRVAPWLSSPFAQDRILALRILAAQPSTESWTRIAALLSDPERSVRSVAAESLGRAPSSEAERASSALLVGLDDVEPEVRVEVARSLGRLGRASSALPLAGHLSDAEEEVRSAIALSLGALGEDSVAPALLTLLGDPEDRVVLSALRSLAALRFEPGVFGVLSLLERPHVDAVARAALETLVAIGSEEALSGVMRKLFDPGFRVHLLPLLEDEPGLELVGLEECLGSTAGEQLVGCAQAWLSLGRDPARVLEPIQQSRLSVERGFRLLAGRSSFDVTVFALELLTTSQKAERSAALEYLAGQDELPEEVVGPLVQALTEARTLEEKTWILAALSRSQGGVRASLAEPYLNADSPLVAKAAAAALVAAGDEGPPLTELLTHRRASVAEGALFRLSQGMTSAQGEQILDLVVQGESGRHALLLDVLWAFPTDLSSSDLERLFGLLSHARGGDRDAVLDIVARAAAPARLVEKASELDRADRLKIVQMARWTPDGVERALPLLTDPDPRVAAIAVEIVGELGSADQVLSAYSQIDERRLAPAYLKAAGLRALGVALRRGLELKLPAQVLEQKFCDHPHLGIRAETLRLAVFAGRLCAGRKPHDFLQNAPDARLRLSLARAFSEIEALTPAQKGALRRCTFYETRSEIAELCKEPLLSAGTSTDDSEGKRLIRWAPRPSWIADSAPLYPLLVRQNGRTFSLVTDRRGLVLLPDGKFEVLDAAYSF